LNIIQKSGSFVGSILSSIGINKVTREGGNWLYSFGDSYSCDWGEQSYQKYLDNFIQIPELNAIINYRAQCESMAKFEIVSKETGKPVKNNEPIIRILRNPNWFQAQKEFWIQSSLYRHIFGNEYLYFLTPFGMGTNYKGLYTLPPNMMYITAKTKRFFLEAKMPDDVKYYFRYRNESDIHEFDIKDLIHLNDNRVIFKVDDGNMVNSRSNYLYGTSKQAALTPVIENLRIAHEARGTLRQLPVGILSNAGTDITTGRSVSMNESEKENLQQQLSKYGVSKEKRRLIITNMNLKLNANPVNIKNLMLYEEMEEGTKALSRAYGIPFELLDKNSTYENRLQAERGMYQNTIIPHMNEKCAAINNYIDSDGNKTWELKATFNHLPIFKKDEAAEATTLNTLVSALNTALQAGAITVEEFRAELIKYGMEL
jgi:hypothetical protein